MINQYKVRTIVCMGCGNQVTRRMPAGRRYCTLDCYRHFKRPTRKTGRVIACHVCGKEKYKPQNQLARTHSFCSSACHNIYQSRNKVEYVCKTCGKTFRWSASRRKSHDPKYCSIKCRTACPEWKRKAAIEGNLLQQNRKKPSRLELMGREILQEIGILFSQQVLILDKFVVDAVLDGLQIVIQWDGDYWHGFRKPLDARQRKRVALDKSQDAYMKKCGYTVLRFWEHEVKLDRTKVREDIERAIRIAAA